ncbi:hypothetical protein NMY22_g7776 [Coprinellus aureogranulatus]|nr:hypothetical protein NMY22_g7776 [Coprinellus aureogranulatus]
MANKNKHSKSTFDTAAPPLFLTRTIDRSSVSAASSLPLRIVGASVCCSPHWCRQIHSRELRRHVRPRRCKSASGQGDPALPTFSQRSQHAQHDGAPISQHLLQRLRQQIDDVELEIETLRRCEPSHLPISTPPLISTATRGLLYEIHHFYTEKFVPRIQELQRKRRILSEWHNGYSPVNQLPPEVLSLIFTFATLGHPAPAPWLECPLPLSFMKLAHVCKHWRATAVGYINLRSVLDLSHPRLGIGLILPCRSNSPMTVMYDGQRRTRFAQEARALLYLTLTAGLVRHLVIHNPAYGLELRGMVLPESCIDALSTLETLVLTGVNAPSNLDLFLQKGSPRLRHLALTVPHPQNWHELTLSTTLTHLELENGGRDKDDDIRPPPEIFIDMLKELLNLQSLTLWDMIPNFLNSNPEADSSIQRFSLPALRYLALIDDVHRLAEFLKHPRISAETNVHLYCNTNHEGDQDDDDSEDERELEIAQLLDELQASIGPTHPSQRDVEALHLSYSAADIYHCTTFNLNDCSVVPNLTIDWPDTSTLDLLELLAPRLKLTTLTSLNVETGPGSSFTTPWSLFGRLPSLQIITLQEFDFNFLEMMEQRPDPPLSDPSSPHFPALSTLEFIGVEEDEYELDMEECTRQLVEICKRRAKIGYPLSELHVQESGCFEADHITVIEQSIPSLAVVWDRYHICVDSCITCGIRK